MISKAVGAEGMLARMTLHAGCHAIRLECDFSRTKGTAAQASADHHGGHCSNRLLANILAALAERQRIDDRAVDGLTG